MTSRHLETLLSDVLRQEEPELWDALARLVARGQHPRRILAALRSTLRRGVLMGGLVEAAVWRLWREWREEDR